MIIIKSWNQPILWSDHISDCGYNVWDNDRVRPNAGRTVVYDFNGIDIYIVSSTNMAYRYLDCLPNGWSIVPEVKRMKYLVAVKQVPDTAWAGVDENGNLVREGSSVLDPHSGCALGFALGLKEDGDTVAAVTMGPDRASSVLERCLELGADEVYLLSDGAFAGADVFATARTISAFVTKYIPDVDLIFFGERSMDGDTGHTPAEVAEMLDREQFYYVTSVERRDCGFRVVQDYGDEIRTCNVPAGSVVSVSQSGMAREPFLSDRPGTSEKEIVKLDRIALGLGAYSVGTKGSPTSVIRSVDARASGSGTITDGSDPAKAAEHIRGLLRRDASHVLPDPARRDRTEGFRLGCCVSIGSTSTVPTGFWYGSRSKRTPTVYT